MAASSSSYAWEGNVSRSWEALQEDEHGALRAVAADASGGAGAAAAVAAVGAVHEAALCKRMIRYLCVVVDTSLAMAETDMRPSRRAVTLEWLRHFIVSYFDENPLSNMCLFTSHGGFAHKVAEMSASPTRLLAALSSFGQGGDFSLQNGLMLAQAALKSVPQHGSKEVLVVMASLATCDEGDVFETMDELKRANVRCSVVGLCAEVHVAKYLATHTQGTYGVSRSKEHFRSLLMGHVPPSAVLTETRSELRCSFVRMGFPSQVAAASAGTSNSASANANASGASAAAAAAAGGAQTTRRAIGADSNQITTQGYCCPKCATVVSELPTQCPVCALELIASSHLARSYHHLFPVPRYKSATLAEALAAGSRCSACDVSLAAEGAADQRYFLCPSCTTPICEACEAFVHDTLHVCPACLSPGSSGS